MPTTVPADRPRTWFSGGYRFVATPPETKSAAWEEAKHPRDAIGRFGAGNRVSHPKHGHGTVLAIDAGGGAAVKLDNGTNKVIPSHELSHAPSGKPSHPPSKPVAAGDRVVHPKHGAGTVLGVTGGGGAAVQLDNGTPKVIPSSELKHETKPAKKPAPEKPAAEADTGIGPTGPKLDAPQLKAVQTYAGQGYIDINTYLRTGDMAPDQRLSEAEINSTVKRLDAVMKQHKTTKEHKVWRGVGNLGPVGPGVELDDEGFQSSTPNKDVADEFAGDLLHITVPKGTHAANISDEVGTGEEELLLNRGGTLVVKKVSTDPSTGKRIVHVDLEYYT